MKAEVWEHHIPDLTGVRKVTVYKVEREVLHKEIVNRLRKATSLKSWLHMTRFTPGLLQEASLLFFSVW